MLVDARGLNVGAGQHAQHAGRRSRLLDIDLWRDSHAQPDERTNAAEYLSWLIEIVRKAAAPPNQPIVFDPHARSPCIGSER